MTTTLTILVIAQLAAILFIIYGLLNEQKFIDFEDRLIRMIAKKIYMHKRKKAIAKKRAVQQRRREAHRVNREDVYRRVA